jgi:hypothetical protein
LNKLYRPVKNFKVCIFHDGNIYFEKIKRLATRKESEIDNIERPYLLKTIQPRGKYNDMTSKGHVNSNIEFIFKDYLLKIGHLKAYKPTKSGTVGPHIASTSQNKPAIGVSNQAPNTADSKQNTKKKV